MESEGDGRPSEAIPNVALVLVVVVVVAPPGSSRLLFHTFMAAKPLAGIRLANQRTQRVNPSCRTCACIQQCRQRAQQHVPWCFISNSFIQTLKAVF